MERDFKGVWIPKEIWLAEDLGWTEKFLLTEIDSLSQNNECFATNEYFAKFFKISKDRVSKLVSSLNNKGYVEVKLIYKPGSKQVQKRIITPRGYRQKKLEGIGENNYTPLGENNEDSSSFNNTTINNTNNIKPYTQIENFRLRYSPNQLKIIDDYLEMIRHTRVSAKISDSVILKMYKDWDKHPQICVEYGLKTHTGNVAYHSKKENYTMGIVRNTTSDEAYEKLNNKKEVKPGASTQANTQYDNLF